jgi:hypothetical protein
MHPQFTEKLRQFALRPSLKTFLGVVLVVCAVAWVVVSYASVPHWLWQVLHGERVQSALGTVVSPAGRFWTVVLLTLGGLWLMYAELVRTLRWQGSVNLVLAAPVWGLEANGRFLHTAPGGDHCMLICEFYNDSFAYCTRLSAEIGIEQRPSQEAEHLGVPLHDGKAVHCRRAFWVGEGEPAVNCGIGNLRQIVVAHWGRKRAVHVPDNIGGSIRDHELGNGRYSVCISLFHHGDQVKQYWLDLIVKPESECVGLFDRVGVTIPTRN